MTPRSEKFITHAMFVLLFSKAQSWNFNQTGLSFLNWGCHFKALHPWTWRANISDGSRSKFFDPAQVNFLSGQLFIVWVWIWKISPKNVNFFPFGSKKFLLVVSKSTWVKGGSASYLQWVKSKLGSGQGPSLANIKQLIESKPAKILS